MIISKLKYDASGTIRDTYPLWNEYPELPEGWVVATLGDVRLDKSKSINPAKLPGQTFELYSVPSFSEGEPEIIASEAIGSSKRTVEENAVLLCKINPRINRVWIVGNYSHYLKIASTEWLSFFQLDGISPSYLCYCLQQDGFRDYLATNASGVGGSLMRVRGSTFADYPLPLPPLPEQHRIVAEIEKQFTRLDASIDALKRVQNNLKRYRASVLKAACEGKLVVTEAELARSEGRDYEPAGRLLERILIERRAKWESQEKRRGKYKEPVAPDTSDLPELPEGWVWATVDQASNRIQYGTSSKANLDASGIPVLRMGNILQGDLDLSDLKYLSAQDTDVQKTLLDHGDLLFNRTNSAELVGKCAVFKGTPSPACFASYLIRVSFAMVLPEFASAYINSEHGRRYISQVRSQQVGQANVNGTKLAAMPIPLPPLAEQQRIVAEVERRLSVIQQAEAAVEVGLKRAERLRQSILKQAFSGKLVPQDPNDEPAAVLLERIRTEREAAEAAAKNSRKPRRRRARK